MDAVRHILDQHRFVLDCDGTQSVLEYAIFNQSDKTAIDFTHTFVPPQCRGKGLAEKLVRAGIKWAKEQGYELHASCWYAAKFIR
jgi:predicted GNAT family acetyltransferase